VTSIVSATRGTNVASGPTEGPVSWGGQATPAAWRSRDEREAGPWTNKDVSRTAVVSGVGLIAAVFCWYGGSGADTLDGEMPWLVGSIGAAGVVVCALTAWVIAGFRNVRLAEHATVLNLLPLLELLPGGPEAIVAEGDTRVAVVPGAGHYHRSSCRMVSGKPGVTFAESNSLPDLCPCGICQP
jgi:hypothetical protein